MNSKKALTLALLIVTSMLLLPLYIPTTSAQGSTSYPSNPDFIHLEMTPPPYPIRYPNVGDLGGMWMELYPSLSSKYALTYWIDTDGDAIINASDQIALYNPVARGSKWYHVEWVTATVKLANTTVDPLFKGKPLFLEYNGTIGQFLADGAATGYVLSQWHMVFPKWSLPFTVLAWIDNDADLWVSPGDVLTFAMFGTYLVTEVSTDMIVSEEPAYPENPDFIHLDLEPPALVNATVGSTWHEIYPELCNWYTLSYWVDENPDGRIYQSDQVMLNDTWYHVEWVTVTIKVSEYNETTQELMPEVNMTLEFGGTLDKFMAGPLNYPIWTWWHEVSPSFSTWYHVAGWEDNTNGYLDACDNLTLIYGPPDERAIWTLKWHVDVLKTNLIVSEEPAYPVNPGFIHLDMLPHGDYPPEEPYIGSQWHELYPVFCNTYTIYNWIDTNNNSLIDVCDFIKLEDDVEEKKWYHVEWVTVTMVLNETTSHEIIYVEFGGPWDKFMQIKNPLGTWWHEVWPLFSKWYNLTSWTDDGDLVLDYCDIVDFEELPGYYWHVDALKTDLIVSPVKPPTYFEVVPSTNNIAAVCNNVTLDIDVVNAPETYAWALTLSWNKAVLELAEDALEGNFLQSVYPNGTPAQTKFVPGDRTTANQEGEVTISNTFLGTVAYGAAGNGTLCTVKFHVKGAGLSSVDLTDTGLLDLALVRTDYPNRDGFIGSAVPTHDVNIIDIQILDHQVQQGELPYPVINVIILNEGATTPETVNVTVYADKECQTHNATDPDQLLIGDEIVVGSQIVPIVAGINVVPFTWVTDLVPGEQYIISANATIVGLADEDPNDNVFVDGGIHVVSHNDLKVVDVTVHTPDDLSTFGPYVEKAPYESNPNVNVAQRTVEINVTVLNEGKAVENFDVIVTASNTTHQVTVGTKTVNGLNSPVQGGQTSIVVGFIWDVNATVVPLTGAYNITATVVMLPPGAPEEPKNLDDNTLDLTAVPGVVIVAEHDLRVDSVEVLMDHPEGNYPIRRLAVNVTNVGSVTRKFGITVFADPVPSSFPVVDGDEIFCGGISGIYLAPNATFSGTGIGLPDGTPGWNLTGSITLSDIMLGIIPDPKDRINVTDGDYQIIASLNPDPRYPDKNMLNDYATTNCTVEHEEHDVAVTDVHPVDRAVFPNSFFNVSVTVENQALNNDEPVVTINVYAFNATPFEAHIGTRVVSIPKNSVGKLAHTTLVNCTSALLGNNSWYTLKATATIAASDSDPIDNTRTDLNIHVKIFDVEITSITFQPSEDAIKTAYPTWTVSATFEINVYNSDTDDHTFSCALFIDGELYEWKAPTTVAAKGSHTFTFTWDIPDIEKCYPYPYFTLEAEIMIADANSTNNVIIYSDVHVKWPGDLNDSGDRIDGSDLDVLASRWWFKKYYHPDADMNMDGNVDGSDLDILANQWWKKINPCP